MKSSTLFRLSGLAIIMGALCGILAYANHPEAPPTDLNAYADATYFAHIWMYFAGLLTTMGLPAVFVRQRSRMGVIGFVSTLVTMLTITLTETTHAFFEFAVVPLVVQAHVPHPEAILGGQFGGPVFGLIATVFGLGGILGFAGLALTSLWARQLPRAATLGAIGLLVFVAITMLMIVMPDLSILPDSLYGGLMYGSFGCFGLALLTDRHVAEVTSLAPIPVIVPSASA